MHSKVYNIEDKKIKFSNGLEDPNLEVEDAQIFDQLSEASKVIKSGGLVGIPTETVYGLGANGLDPVACSQIYKVKGRPSDNPLILHISSLNMLKSILPTLSNEIYLKYLPLMQKFWPGPLTLLFPTSILVPNLVTGNQDTVAIRFPGSKVARALIQISNVPIAAPSANKSGRPSPTTATHVLEDLQGLIPLVLDNGPCQVGVESTVLDGLSDPPVILRPGKVTKAMLQRFEGFENTREFKKEEFSKEETERMEMFPKTPGMKYTHYSPLAHVILLESKLPTPDFEAFRGQVDAVLSELEDKVQRIRIVTTSKILDSNWVSSFDKFNKHIDTKSLTQDEQDLNQVATNLFDSLRQLDQDDIDLAIYQSVQDSDLGIAIMNRLRKAAKVTVTY